MISYNTNDNDNNNDFYNKYNIDVNNDVNNDGDNWFYFSDKAGKREEGKLVTIIITVMFGTRIKKDNNVKTIFCNSISHLAGLFLWHWLIP